MGFLLRPFLTVEKLWPSGLVVQMPIMAIKKQKSQEKINQVDLVIQHFSSSEMNTDVILGSCSATECSLIRRAIKCY